MYHSRQKLACNDMKFIYSAESSTVMKGVRPFFRIVLDNKLLFNKLTG
jgi:hypothetical protein